MATTPGKPASEKQARVVNSRIIKIGGEGGGHQDCPCIMQKQANMEICARYVRLVNDPFAPITKEVVNYESGVPRVRRKTVQEVLDELKERLRTDGCYPDESISLSGEYMFDGEKEFPSGYWSLACYAVSGASEGWYIHVDAIYPPGKIKPIFLGKTFQGLEFAFKVAQACAKHLGV